MLSTMCYVDVMTENEDSEPIDTEALKRTIGERVRALREEEAKRTTGGFSQYDLADALTAAGCQISQGMIGHIEIGRKLPSLQTFVALAEYFGTSLDFLAGRTTNPSSIAAIDEDLQTGGISGRLGAIYKALPADQKNQVYHFAEALNAVAQHAGDTQETVTNERFVSALLDAFQRRMGLSGVEAVIDELAREFPHLALDTPALLKFRKKKRG